MSGHSGSVRLRGESAATWPGEELGMMWRPDVADDDTAEVLAPSYRRGSVMSRAHQCANETRSVTVFQTDTGCSSAKNTCAPWGSVSSGFRCRPAGCRRTYRPDGNTSASTVITRARPGCHSGAAGGGAGPRSTAPPCFVRPALLLVIPTSYPRRPGGACPTPVPGSRRSSARAVRPAAAGCGPRTSDR